VYMSVGAPFLCLSAGRVWFEVDLLEASPNMFVQVGFVGTSFHGTSLGLGEEATSWAVYENGHRCHR
jgi:hypothetical protein